MKKILDANELHWIIVAAVFALILWLAPKVDGSELDDYLKKNNLNLPASLKDRFEQQGLAPAFGMECDDKISSRKQFVVFYVRKEDMPSEEEVKELNMIDPSIVVLKVRYNQVKKSVSVEYTTYEKQIWGSIESGYKKVILEFFGL